MIKKYGKNIIFFFVLIFLTFFLLFRGQDLGLVFETLKTAKIRYIFLGLVLMLIYLFLESTNLKLLLKNLGTKIKFLSAYKYAFIGFFYSSITPSATGGQPMQVYHMKKDKIDISKSSIVFLLMASAYHIVTLLLMIVGVIYNYKYLYANMHYFGILLAFGILIQICVLIVLLSVIFSKNATNYIIKIVTFIVDKLHIAKGEKFLKNLDKELKDFRECADYIKKHKLLFIRTILISLIEMIVFYSVIYMTVLSLGVTGVSYIKVITIQAVLFSGISSIPLPGATGVSELGYKILFLPIYGKGVNSAIIINRFMNFYSFVIISGIVSIYTYFKQHKKKKTG